MREIFNAHPKILILKGSQNSFLWLSVNFYWGPKKFDWKYDFDDGETLEILAENNLRSQILKQCKNLNPKGNRSN